ncbi:MAG: ATP-binding protein [Gemmataceae bacterium]
MSETNALLLKANLRQLKLPTMHAEWEKLAREAAGRDEPYDEYLLRLTELEVAARTANAIAARIRTAGFPVLKEFDTFDFAATPNLPKQKVLELARGDWIDQHFNCCLIGGSGTGKTHVATAQGSPVPAREAREVRHRRELGHATRSGPAATPPRPLPRPTRPLRPDRGGRSSATCRSAAPGLELLFQVFADRYEQQSLVITSNLPFGEWGQVFQGERMTAALLDRLTHKCHIFEMNGESYRFRESMKTKKDKDAKKAR